MNHQAVYFSLLLSTLSANEYASDAFSYQKVTEKVIQFSAATSLGTLSLLGHIGWGLTYLIPGAAHFRNEAELLSSLSGSAALHLYRQFFKETSTLNSSESSWYLNQLALSQIKPETEEEKQLITFLQNRWLAKATGFFHAIIKWIYPCFGIQLQIHPETTSHYARNPANKISFLYQKVVEQLKDPHLVLTRPYSIAHYIPPDFSFDEEKYEQIGILRTTPEESRKLLDWISLIGLTANRIELDRMTAPSCVLKNNKHLTITSVSQEELLSLCNTLDPQENPMITGSLKVLRAVLEKMGPETNSTKCAIRKIAMGQLKKTIEEMKEKGHSFELLELLHASLSTLLEVTSPYITEDFSNIYKNVLTFIPDALKPLTNCGLHSSGMTTVAGIFNALGPPRVMYGENSYFECIHIAEKLGHAIPLQEAHEEDFKEVDLILAQFNPALKRIDLSPTDYRVERVEETLHRCLQYRDRKPLTLAIDCTLDYLNSPKTAELLHAFKQEIQEGRLNLICYRSGLKFDIFGMDNYCGAPYFMIHNGDTQWDSFKRLSQDPALQTDRLSLNWFSLAFEHTSHELDLYRKQIFTNTRELLNRIPPRLFDSNSIYRVMHVDQEADIAFLDIKVSGPLHQLKAPALVGGCLNLKCLEAGLPIFHRPSIGFYHPNFTMLFSKENSTIRLTLGVDPAQVDVLVDCFREIDKLNEK